MKNLFVAIFILLVATLVLLFSQNSRATQVTLTDPDEQTTSDGKMCVYENSQVTKVIYVGEHSKCPYAKTFTVEDE